MSKRFVPYKEPLGRRIGNVFKNVAFCAAGIFVVGGGATQCYGVSDRERAEETLEDLGLKVLRHNGHPAFGWGGGDGIFSDSFTIQKPNGEEGEVIVSRGVTKGPAITIVR